MLEDRPRADTMQVAVFQDVENLVIVLAETIRSLLVHVLTETKVSGVDTSAGKQEVFNNKASFNPMNESFDGVC